MQITDTITGQSVTVDKSDIAETIRTWYPEAPAEVTAAIDDFQAAALRGDDLTGFEAYLMIRVEA